MQATWLEANLAPTFVTTDKTLADELEQLYRHNLNKAANDTEGLSAEELAHTTYGGLSGYVLCLASIGFARSFQQVASLYALFLAVLFLYLPQSCSLTYSVKCFHCRLLRQAPR